MNVRHGVGVLSLAGALLVGGAAPAVAGGPRVSTGCSFGHGVLTCVTTSTTTATVGPFTTDGQIGASETFGGLTGEQICEGFFHIPDAVAIDMDAYSFKKNVVTTTTTKRHGLNGKVFSTRTTSTATYAGLVGGGLNCQY
jgi:hypothetical protein